MKEKLEHLSAEAERALSTAEDRNQLMQVRSQFLGRKGKLTLLIKQLGTLPEQERPLAGQLINQAKNALAETIDQRLASIKEKEENQQQDPHDGQAK